MFYKDLFKPDIDVVQIEVSSICDASCIYCPLTIYGNNIDKRFLSFKALEIILPQLKKETYIHLQGWGEPLLNPDFLKMVAYIKEKGFKVGTTTNGNPLNENMLKKLVNYKIDYISFSTAGVSLLENDLTRKGTSFENVVEKIKLLEKFKKEKKSDLPKIHISNLLLKSSLNEFFLGNNFYSNIPCDQIVVSSPSLVCSKDFIKEVFLAESEAEWGFIKKRLDNFSKNINREIHFQIISPLILKQRCSEDISKSIFIGSKGDVFPCVIKGVPLKKSVDFYLRGKKKKLVNNSFGNIFNESLKFIWKKAEYKKFRNNSLQKNDFCRVCFKKSIDQVYIDDRVDLDSLDLRWQIIREANQEKADIERLKKET